MPIQGRRIFGNQGLFFPYPVEAENSNTTPDFKEEIKENQVLKDM